MAADEIDVIAHLLEVEKEASNIVADAQRKADDVISAARQKADAEFQKQYQSIVLTISENELKSRKNIEDNKGREIESYHAELSAKEKDFASFFAALEKNLAE